MRTVIFLVAFGFSAFGMAGNNPTTKTMDLNSWIADHFIYPQTAKENQEEGIVYVSFSVSENGAMTDVRIEQGVSPTLDAAALEMTAKIPAGLISYIPGNQNTRYILPIKFAIH